MGPPGFKPGTKTNYETPSLYLAGTGQAGIRWGLLGRLRTDSRTVKDLASALSRDPIECASQHGWEQASDVAIALDLVEKQRTGGPGSAEARTGENVREVVHL